MDNLASKGKWVTSVWSIYCLVCCYLLLNNCCWALAYGHGKCHCFTHRVSKKPGDNKAKKSKQVSQKYTAARLHEKGVLIEIEDLQQNQWVSTSGHVFEFICSYSTICLCICISCNIVLVSYFNRYKNVIFEISPSEVVGVFDVKAKLMGVHLETLMLEYQVKVLLLIFLVSVSHASQKDVLFCF